MSREEIEQVEKELDAVLEMVQRPVPVKNTDSREETASLQENDPLQTKRKTEKEKEYYKKMRNSDAKLGDDKVKLARIKYRGKGRYIDEILK